MERIFYANTMAFPEVVHDNFRSKYDSIKWRNDEDDFLKSGAKVKQVTH